MSPFSRTIQTAEIVQNIFPSHLSKNHYYTTIVSGFSKGETWEELRQTIPDIYQEYEKDKPFVPPPEGETAYEVESRIKTLFWERVPRTFPNKTRIFTITHLNPVRAMLRLLNLADWQIYYQNFKNASLTRIKTDLKSGEVLLFDFSCSEENGNTEQT